MVALETGATEQADADIAACRRIADRQRIPEHRWQAAVFEAMRVLRSGAFSQGRLESDTALALGQRGSGDMASVMWGAQVLLSAWGSGQLQDVVAAVGDFADRYPHAPAWRAALAFCHAELGRSQAARTELEVCLERGLGGVPRDGNYLTTLALLAHVAAGLGDVGSARLLEQALRPYAERTVVIAAGAVTLTSVHLPLGVLQSLLGDHEQALHHLARARAEHLGAGALPFVVWTACEQIRVLVARSGPEDHAEAARLLVEALPLARRLGMAAHVPRLLGLSADLLVGTTTGGGDGVSAEDDRGAGPVTVLTTDIAGSTELTENLGEHAAHQLLQQHRRIVESAAERHGGVVVKSLGDGVLLALADAREALDCALDIAQVHEQSGGSAPLRLRMAVHTGPVLRQRESLYGRTMIIAARLADQAGAGEVLVSGEARQAAGPADELRFDSGSQLELRGVSAPQRVFRLLGRDRS